jgi:hypothetical protein
MVGVLVNCPAYYSVSAAKAELLNKIKDMPEEAREEEEQGDVNEKKVNKELRNPCSFPRKVVNVLVISRASGP